MPKKRFSAEQIVVLLRQIEVATSLGKSISIACREAGISDQSYFRWRKEYGGLDLDHSLTDILYQHDGDYCIADVPSRWDIGGAQVCGAGGRYPSEECGRIVL